jgi:nitrite reductase (NO-forming) / hydroxylamine reductase
MRATPFLHRLLGIAALLAVVPMAALAQEKKGVTESELKYQAGASPLGAEAMYQASNPKAPAMTQVEFER